MLVNIWERCPSKGTQAKYPYLCSSFLPSVFPTSSKCSPAGYSLAEPVPSDVGNPRWLPLWSLFPSADVLMAPADLWGIFLSVLHPHHSCHLVHFCFISIQQMCSHHPSHADLNEPLTVQPTREPGHAQGPKPT